MRIVFVNRFYWPDEQATAQLLADLAESLASEGRQVSVICSMPAGVGAARRETRNGVSIHRVGLASGRTVSLPRRALAFANFLLGAAGRSLELLREGDLLVTLTDPPMLGTCLWPCARLRKARQLHWVQDIYPEVALALFRNAPARLLLRLLLPIRNFALADSAGCVTLGEEMAALLRGAGMKRENVAVIPNWAPEGVRPLSAEERERAKAELDLAGRFVALYSGNLGRVHEIDVLWRLACALRDRPEVLILVVGGGAGRAQLEEAVRREGLGNLRFMPPRPRDRLSESLGSGDVHLITLREDCRAAVYPSKFYGVAAAGRPMLFVGPEDCELARLIETREMGRAFAPGRVADLAAYVAALAASPELVSSQGAKALEFADAEGRREHAAARWSRLLQSLSGKSTS